MEEKGTDSGSPETPIIFPAVPWLRDGLKYDAYLESCLSSLRSQVLPDGVEILPVYMTSTIEDDIEITPVNQMDLVTPKLNEIVSEFQANDEATHLWILNADNEYPPDALILLLEHEADVASGISPPRQKNWMYSTAYRWVAAPTPKLLWSQPYFKIYRLKEIRNKVIGDGEMVGTGHFCLLVKRHVFDEFRFRWRGKKKEDYGSELMFWMDAYMLGYKTRIDGRVLCGHLPNFALADYVGE